MSNQPTDTSAAGRGGGEAECLRLFENALLRTQDTRDERTADTVAFRAALFGIRQPPTACDSKPHEAAVKLAEYLDRQSSGLLRAEDLNGPFRVSGDYQEYWRRLQSYRAARAAGGEGERRDEAERIVSEWERMTATRLVQPLYQPGCQHSADDRADLVQRIRAALRAREGRP